MKSQGNSKKPLIYYLIAVAVVVLLLNLFLFPSILKQQVTQVDYGTFLSMVDSGRARSVEIENSNILFTAVDEKGNEKLYSTGRMDDYVLVQRLYEAKVEFKRVVPRENSPIVNFLLTWVLPLLIFIAIGQFLMRTLSKKMGGGPGAMKFGKSNAKIYVEAQTGKSFEDVAGQEEAKEALEEIVDFLETPRSIGRSARRFRRACCSSGLREPARR
nr:ATP-dependent metallopeptidase FtsH/Yme1/Tma family protein [Cohnella sp. AR92]